MSDKLARAQHTRVAEPASEQPANAPQRPLRTHARAADPGSTSEIKVGGRHAGLDRTAIAAAVAQQVMPKPQPRLDPASAKARLRSAAPGETSEIHIGGRHAGPDRTTPPRDPFEPSTPDPHEGTQPSQAAPSSRAERAAFPGSTSELPIISKHAGPDRTLARVERAEPENATATSVGSSAALISVCVLVSRITGFARTWVMAFALGATLLSSSYQVANNLPNQLYELVVGGMLVTAFLPVYLSVKKKLGTEASNRYASNLLSLVVIFLGIVSLLCMAFPAQAIFTQSFMSDQAEMSASVYFFQFFAIQIVFYGVSAIVSGLLNANRDYLWSSIAPVANNIIVIGTFLAYAFVAPSNPQLALLIIAVGNPLGVFVQMAIQLPALKRNGIHIRPRIDFHDPALRETLSIGIPAVIVMLGSFAVVSVQQAAALVFTESGPSILAFSRLWFTLPYAFLAVPITTAMFTELADMQSEGNIEGVKRGIVSGTNQILFFMIPFALYLIAFSMPLITLYHAGAFTIQNIIVIADYLAVFALSLPFYAVNTYLQKIFSSLRKMTAFACFNIGAALVQIALTAGAALAVSRGIVDLPIEAIALAELAFYLVSDLCLFVYLRKQLGAFGLRSTARAFVTALLLGILGATVGFAIQFMLGAFVEPLNGSILQALAYLALSGIPALAITFGLALKLNIPEAAFLSSIASKVKGKLGRG